MTIKELSQYFYLGKEIKAKEKEIELLQKELDNIAETVASVQGSKLQVPFNLHSVQVKGISINDRKKWGKINAELQDLKSIIELSNVRKVFEYNRLTRFIESISDSLTRQVFYFRFAKGMEWKDVAIAVGGNNTEDSVKKICYRYLKKYNKKHKTCPICPEN